jgi:hypothetical protein
VRCVCGTAGHFDGQSFAAMNLTTTYSSCCDNVTGMFLCDDRTRLLFLERTRVCWV